MQSEAPVTNVSELSKTRYCVSLRGLVEGRSAFGTGGAGAFGTAFGCNDHEMWLLCCFCTVGSSLKRGGWRESLTAMAQNRPVYALDFVGFRGTTKISRRA